jgi:hypothetical protein
MITKKVRKKWGEPGSKVGRVTDARVYSRGYREVAVTIYPDGQIGLRLKGTRKQEYVNAADIYRQAVQARVVAERAAKKKARKK